MSTAVVPAPRSWLTGGQFTWILLQLLILVGSFLLTLVVQPADASLLWTSSTGVKMSLAAVSGTLLSFAIFLGAGTLINRWLPAGDPQAKTGRWLAQGALGTILAVLFLVPAIYVITIGPASLRILETMTAG